MTLTTVPDSLLSTPTRKNIIINGGMAVAQRGISFSPTPNGQHVVDRLRYSNNTTAVVDTVQSFDSEATPFYHYVEQTVTTADASVAANAFSGFAYFIEGQDISFLKSGFSTAETVTLSFYTKHSVTGTYCVAFRNADVTRNYVAEYTQAVSNEWERQSITLTLDTTGTWNTDHTTGLSLFFSHQGGTDFQTSEGSWAAGNKITTSNQINGLATIGNIFRYSGLQLEVGSTATPFVQRSYAEELLLCQRYFQHLENAASTNWTVLAARNSNTAEGLITYPTKRTTPTVSTTLQSGDVRILGVSGESLSSLTLSGNTESMTVTWNDSGTPFATREGYLFAVSNTPTAGRGFDIDAEL